jgi:OPA family glycerol-3-phosphate transporter-like MFS transporter
MSDVMHSCEAAPHARAGDGSGLRARQLLTVGLLFGGYAACYFCRADLSVAAPLLIDELGSRGVSHADALVHIGQIASLGVFAYAMGKLFLTGLGDFWGGRPNFLISLGGATIFTVLFALGGTLPVFTMAWLGNRLTQSIGWAGLIKVSSRWFDFTSHGTIVGVLSISYLIGDAAARQWMGALIHHGYGWRSLFYLAAAVAGFFLLANALLLRESRVNAGYAEALPNPQNVYGDRADRPSSVAALVLPLLRSRAFLLVCLLSLGCTIVRETFNYWTPVYLRDFFGYSIGGAASASAVFPAVGAVSVLGVGWLSDRLGANSRPAVMAVGLLATALALLTLALLPSSTLGPMLPLVAIGTTALCLIGPYSYLGGALAIDFGGKQGAALSSGIIDGVGYLGSVLGGVTVARVSIAFGWQGVFLSLAVISLGAAIGAGVLFRLGRPAQGRAQARAGATP